jgi:hypothetical protein
LKASPDAHINPRHRDVVLVIGLTAKRTFKDCELSLDISLCVPTLDDVFAIPAK